MIAHSYTLFVSASTAGWQGDRLQGICKLEVSCQSQQRGQARHATAAITRWSEYVPAIALRIVIVLRIAIRRSHVHPSDCLRWLCSEMQRLIGASV